MQILIGSAMMALIIAVGVCFGLLAFAHIGLVIATLVGLAAAYGGIVAIAAVCLIPLAIAGAIAGGDASQGRPRRYAVGEEPLWLLFIWAVLIVVGVVGTAGGVVWFAHPH